jgi:hypothetical protein
MIKKAIITPTFSGHFGFVREYLKSFDAYLLDRGMPIYFIIDRVEADEFAGITAPFEDRLSLHTVFLEDVFKKFKIDETPEEALGKYGRLSFQTLKKFYGGLYVGAEKFLLLDSESMLVKPTDMGALFDAYFKRPRLFLSRVADKQESYKDGFTYCFIEAIAPLFGKKPEYWTYESYEWFYELKILEDLVEKLGSPIDIVRGYRMPGRFPNVEGVLEALLYTSYIYYNNDRYGYAVHIVEDEFAKYFGEEECGRFFKEFYASRFAICGVMECFMFFANKQNKGGFVRFLNDFNISSLRTELPESAENYAAQKYIIDNSGVRFCPSSQDHWFGIKAGGLFGVKYRLLCQRELDKLKRQVRIFADPIRGVVRWFLSPLKILKYSARIGIKCITNI